MGQHTIKIESIDHITHDVLRIKTEKPGNYNFNPGQATTVAINKKGWEKKDKPFTFTNLPGQSYLEFVIKTYPSHEEITNELLKLKSGDELIIEEAWGTINYKGEGLFIAGGAGVTPFISIFRYLKAKNEIGKSKLIFANKTSADIINKEEFKEMLNENFINILSQEESKEYSHGFINKEFLKASGAQNHKYIYLCGPRPMMDSIEEQLMSLGIKKEAIVKEEF